MNQGKYKIAQQIKARGIFASIDINAELTQSSTSIEIAYEAQLTREWKIAIEFGASYFLQNMKVPNKHTKGIKILVQQFHGNEVDTTSVLISIVTIKALMHALKVDIYREPFIDTDKLIYGFPF
jgi:hypothetical protein